MEVIVYGLCTLTSLMCFALLLRQHRRAPSPLALRSSLAFLCLALANIILFIDLIILPQVDLRIWRDLANLAGGLILLFALTSNSERNPR